MTQAPRRAPAAGLNRALGRLEELFEIGPGPHAGRAGLSAEEERACQLAAEWMAAAGL
jgi:hypothetical protein